MKKTLILVAGPPATGKSYLISKIREKIKDFFMISPDEIKELYADKFGFNDVAEKKELEQKAWHFYYDTLQKYMWLGKSIIVTEYPFSDKQKMILTELSNQYQYHVITIRLVCDFEVLWQRRAHRDLEQSRHLCHIMSYYHHTDKLDNRRLADSHISKKEFKNIIRERKYNNFSLGKLYQVNVTDYNKVNYDKLIEDLLSEVI